MTPETLQALGQYVVIPICGAGAFIAFLHYAFKGPDDPSGGT